MIATLRQLACGGRAKMAFRLAGLQKSQGRRTRMPPRAGEIITPATTATGYAPEAFRLFGADERKKPRYGDYRELEKATRQQFLHSLHEMGHIISRRENESVKCDEATRIREVGRMPGRDY